MIEYIMNLFRRRVMFSYWQDRRRGRAYLHRHNCTWNVVRRSVPLYRAEGSVTKWSFKCPSCGVKGRVKHV